MNNTATTRGRKVFDGMSITSARFSNVTDIANVSFEWYGALKEVYFPKVKTIGGNAFYKAYNLGGAIDMPEVTSIGGNAFSGTSITGVNFPKLTVLNARVLSECGKLTSVCLPLVTAIKTAALSSCTTLTTLDLPSVTFLDDQAFGDCISLETLILRSDTVCTMAYQTALTSWNGATSSLIAQGKGYVYVPAALVDSYKAATNWSVFADQIRAIEDYPDITGG